MRRGPLLMIALVPCLMAAGANDYAGEAGLAVIRNLIGNADCQADKDCRIIGVGAAACGGPEAYLAWSTRVTAGDELAKAVALNAQARRDELERLGWLSTCAVPPMPVARCQHVEASAPLGRCTLESAPGAR